MLDLLALLFGLSAILIFPFLVRSMYELIMFDWRKPEEPEEPEEHENPIPCDFHGCEDCALYGTSSCVKYL